MKVIVRTRDALDADKVLAITHVQDDYIVTAQPNDHGDLVVYRDHGHMLTPQPIASYAVGEWISHDTVFGADGPT